MRKGPEDLLLDPNTFYYRLSLAHPWAILISASFIRLRSPQGKLMERK